MPVDFSELVYHPAYDTFARAITVTPLKSQPGASAYPARGIFNTEPVDVVALDGSIVSEQRTILDIRQVEFPVLPEQKDHINIPADGGLPDLGDWEVADAMNNGGGEVTLTLHKVVSHKP
jgi:hypothetical protein